jgi:hypothetical protein
MSRSREKNASLPWGTTAMLAPAGGTKDIRRVDAPGPLRGLLVEIAFFFVFLGELILAIRKKR